MNTPPREITLMGDIIFDLNTAHTSISIQSSNSVVFRLQPMYFLSTSLQRHMLWVSI